VKTAANVRSRYGGPAGRRSWSSAAAAALVVAGCAALVATAGAGQNPPPQGPSQQKAAPVPGQPAQQTPPQPQQGAAQIPPANVPPSVFRTRTEEVIVPVLVRTSSGDPVFDLARKDFRILEDNIEQKIDLFSNDPFPLSVVLLVDDDLPQSVADKVDRSLGAVTGGMAEGDEMAVVLFAQFPRTVVEFGTNLDALHTALQRTQLQGKYPLAPGPTWTQAPHPTTSPASDIGVSPSAKVATAESKGLDDAMLYCADMLRTRGRDRRKMVLVVSDGRNSHNNIADYGQAIRALLSADVTVYGVGVSAAVLDRKRAAIGRYVDETGGDVFYAASQSGMEEHYSQILTGSRNRYTLSYQPRGTDRTKEFHEIEVKVERPGLKVVARDGYYVLVAK